MASNDVITQAKENDDKREIRIYSHSNLFYWWPLWFAGFVCFAITYFEDNRMVIVPPESRAIRGADGILDRIDINYGVDTLEAKQERSKNYFRDVTEEDGGAEAKLNPRASIKPWLAPSYFLLMLLVILITNVPLRGLWSVIVIITIAMLALIFALLGWWDDIFRTVGNLHVYINMSGYLFISSVLFVAWAVAFFFLDRRTYIAFRPGQIRVREEIIGGEKMYDTVGVSAEKHRDDLFRHWVLGLLSGDLTVHVREGGTNREIRIPNVLMIGWRLPRIQEMLREKPVV